MHKALLPGETALMLFEQLQMFTTNAAHTNTMTGLCQNMESGLNRLTQHYKKLKGTVHPHNKRTVKVVNVTSVINLNLQKPYDMI